MAYTPTVWTNSIAASAKLMNHLETQYGLLKIDYDAHAHTSTHYTKTEADATFFTTSFYTGFDADKIDGSHYSDLIASSMPNGAIMIWHSTDGNLPSGWGISDGSVYGAYTSPNLRDRFVVGAGNLYAVNATGGPAAWNGTITPTGTVTVGAHTLTNGRDRQRWEDMLHRIIDEIYSGRSYFTKDEVGVK